MNNTSMSVNPTSGIEMQEIIAKLKEKGYSELVECLMDNEAECYTKKGRLNKSSTCRRMDWKNKQLEDALTEMRELLQKDFDLDIVEEEDEESENDD